MKIYETIQGDTFDIIAKKFYGNEENIEQLIKANLESKDYVVFPAGVVLSIPELNAEETTVSNPLPWGR